VGVGKRWESWLRTRLSSRMGCWWRWGEGGGMWRDESGKLRMEVRG